MAERQGTVEGVVRSFWKNKKVLITGHTGFKGSWLSLWLHDMGAQVYGYALKPPTKPSLFEDAKIEHLITSNIGDVRDFNEVQKYFSAVQPEIIIHMAAQPLVRYSYSNPIETYMTNVMGTVHVLEAAKNVSSVKAIVNVTTDKCYENKEWHWGYREDEPMGGHDPYSSSKGCSELVTSAYRSSYFANSKIALASARAGNVIGGGDWALDRLIPDIMRAISNGETVKIRNPKAIRPWQHVLEPLSGYLVLAQFLYEHGQSFAQAFNFGPNDEDAKEVQWIVETMTKQWGQGASYEVLKTANDPHEAHYLKLDCSKAKAMLHWHPRMNLTQTISSIVEWNKSYKGNPNSAREVTLQQIREFEKI
jgi:CDP-glucose 4,6-dehydratase